MKIPTTYEECNEDEKFIIDKLRKFKNRGELAKKHPGVYARLRNEYSRILDIGLPVIKIISFDDVLKDAQKYSTKSEWIKASRSLYVKASMKGWLSECVKHMTSKIKNWTYNDITKEALKYKTKGDWKKNSPSSYDCAVRNGIDNFNQHMTSKLRSFTKEEYEESAKLYKTQTEWVKGTYPGIIMYGYRKGWLKEATVHMLKNNISKKVKRCDGKIYYSITEAARDLRVAGSNIIVACKKGTKCGGYNWEYVNEE